MIQFHFLNELIRNIYSQNYWENLKSLCYACGMLKLQAFIQIIKPTDSVVK